VRAGAGRQRQQLSMGGWRDDGGDDGRVSLRGIASIPAVSRRGRQRAGASRRATGAESVVFDGNAGSRLVCTQCSFFNFVLFLYYGQRDSVAEWLACWTRAQKGPGSNRSRYAVRQTAHTHCASVHQAAKLVAALLRVARVTAGLAESKWQPTTGFMTHVTCRLTAKNRDQLRNAR